MFQKNLRRAFSLFLILCLLLSGGFVFASEDADPAARFLDVPETAWYREAVGYTVERGYFSGVSDDRFDPAGKMTRAMLTAVLWRVAGSPEPTETAPFLDVDPKRYYARPVAWAYENGVVSGTSPESFSPNAEITRQQMAVMLFRFAELRDYDPGCDDEILNSFPDQGRISPYAVGPTAWAVTRYLLRGRSRNGISYLEPRETLTRAEAAVMIRRFDENILNGIPPVIAPPEEAEEPEDSLTLWVNGVEAKDSPVWDGEPYVSAALAAAAADGTAGFEENICLALFGHRVYLSQKSAAAILDGYETELDLPCRYREGDWYVPALLLPEVFGFQALADEEYHQIFYTKTVKNTEVPEGKRVVILRYHCVTDDIWGSDEEAFISPAVMEEQIVKMKELGCTFLTFEDLDRVDEYELPVLLTFDDGYRDNYTELFPILQRQNVKATVFMITKYIGTHRSLTADQLRELSDSGLVSIQSHTQNHKDLTTFTEEELRADFETSQLALARITGKIPFVLCYPRGKYNELVETVAADTYEFGILANTAAYFTGTDPFAVSRFGIHRSTTVEQWTAFLFPEEP